MISEDQRQSRDAGLIEAKSECCEHATNPQTCYAVALAIVVPWRCALPTSSSLPTISRTVPPGAQWAYEIKHDRFRFICRRDPQLKDYCEESTCAFLGRTERKNGRRYYIDKIIRRFTNKDLIQFQLCPSRSAR